MSTKNETPEKVEVETQATIVPIEEAAIVKLVKGFPKPVLESVLMLVGYQADLIDKTKEEIEQASKDLATTKECLSAAEELGIKALTTRHKRVMTRIEREIEFLNKRLAALESGYLHIPRFDYASIEWSSERMNYPTLKRLKEAKDAGLFDDFGVVQDKYTHPRRSRDPLLVGILRGAYGAEEHFFIGVWY